MSQEKLNRRKAMGDDPTAMSMSNTTFAGSPQPIPSAPQGAGNMMNNPQVGQSMGGGMPQGGSLSGGPQSPYGDPVFEQDVFAKVGTPGYMEPSGRNQNIVEGRGLNQPYGMVDQPMRETQDMMEPMRLAQEAGDRGEKMYGVGEQPPYQVGPLGMMGFDMDMAQSMGVTNPGAISPMMSGGGQGGLPVTGTPDVQASMSQQAGMMAPVDGGMVPGSTKTTIRKGNK